MAAAPRLVVHSASVLQESPTRFITGGFMHTPLVHSCPDMQARQAAPPVPQLMTLVLLRGTQLPLIGSTQPSQVELPPPPPAPPPVPPSVVPPPPPVPVVQLKAFGSHTMPRAEQLMHDRPALPQVASFALLGAAMHPPERQQPAHV